VKELEVIDIIDVSIRAHTLHTPAVGNNVMGSLLRLFKSLFNRLYSLLWNARPNLRQVDKPSDADAGRECALSG
jgi:hypothetical protein